MNWKAEGYKVGEKALLVSTYFYSDPQIKDVEIVYVGTKRLKIKQEDMVIEFEKPSKNSSMFGLVYSIYKNKEEYDLMVENKEKAKLLVREIDNVLYKLSLEKLLLIKAIIDKGM